MNIKREMQILKEEIDQEMVTYLDGVIKEAKKTDVFTASAIRYFKKTMLAGGKRIRPIMMYWGYHAAGGTNRKEIIKTSISIELIHAFLLMHDDIIDRDDLRHGKKTIHAHYRDYYKRFFCGSDAEHFGKSIAIISGDLVYSLGNQVLFSSKFEPRTIVRALNKLQEIVGLTCVGEIQDIYMEYGHKVTRQAILRMYENKTARYTFDGPLKLGAILADADDDFCKKIEKFSIPVGIAFQIRDDMLGIYGDAKKTGKPVGSDIAEGKRTLLVETALKNADKKTKKEIMSLLGNQKIDDKGVKRFQHIMEETGALADVERYMQELIVDGKNALMQMNISDDARKFLSALVTYLSDREK
jgi:geranylgeranyl diphosphate synthase type I